MASLTQAVHMICTADPYGHRHETVFLRRLLNPSAELFPQKPQPIYSMFDLI